METVALRSKIYTIRNVQVMLDFDLAELYEVETRVLNQAVKRNIERFPVDFMFQLNKEEWNGLMSQIVISKRGGTRKLPYAFTEQGLAMLSGVLKSKVAIQVNIAIMRTFVAIRQAIMPLGSNSDIKQIENRLRLLEEVSEETLAAINDLSEDTRKEFDDIYIALTEMAESKKQNDKPRKRIGYIQDEEK